jgi:hypothetical protein
MKMKRIIELVNSGVKGWFTELDVAWVLDLPDDAYVREIERTGRSWGFIAFSAPSWIHALAKIMETIVRFTPTLPLPDQFFLRRVTIEQDTAESEEQAIPYQ